MNYSFRKEYPRCASSAYCTDKILAVGGTFIFVNRFDSVKSNWETSTCEDLDHQKKMMILKMVSFFDN